MIRFSKYFWAHLISIMGMVMVMVGSPFPILYAFVGGWFIGTGLKWARQSGEEKKNLTNKKFFVYLCYNYKMNMKAHGRYIINFVMEAICNKWFQQDIARSGVFS